MTEPSRQKMPLKAYRSLLRHGKVMAEDYEHLAPDADFRIDPARRRRTAKMREASRRVEELNQLRPARAQHVRSRKPRRTRKATRI